MMTNATTVHIGTTTTGAMTSATCCGKKRAPNANTVGVADYSYAGDRVTCDACRRVYAATYGLAPRLADRLRDNADDYHFGRVDHARFGIVNREIWAEAERANCVSAVTALVR